MSFPQTAGIKIGHATDFCHQTGCTVFVCPEGSVGGVDVRGMAPGSRETALLDPVKSVPDVTAIMLSGGSAFGLATADGAARNLLKRGYGHPTPIMPIPIVPAAVIYDIHLHRSENFPDAELGWKAVDNAFKNEGNIQQGNFGAGAGAVCGNWKGRYHGMKSGFGFHSMKLGSVEIFAAVVVNPVGDVIKKDGSVLAGARDHSRNTFFGDSVEFPQIIDYRSSFENTTLVVIGTTAKLDKVGATRMAQRGHDAIAVSIKPSHTTHDGDVVFAVSTSNDDTFEFDNLANAACYCIENAIRNSVYFADSIDDFPAIGKAAVKA